MHGLAGHKGNYETHNLSSSHKIINAALIRPPASTWASTLSCLAGSHIDNCELPQTGSRPFLELWKKPYRTHHQGDRGLAVVIFSSVFLLGSMASLVSGSLVEDGPDNIVTSFLSLRNPLRTGTSITWDSMPEFSAYDLSIILPNRQEKWLRRKLMHYSWHCP